MAGQLIECVASAAALKKCCKLWQKRLRLEDWDVDIQLVKHSQMHNQDAMGEISMFDAKRRATVHIVRNDDYQNMLGGNNPPQDMEVTVVHELLHIHFQPLRAAGKRASTAEEQAIHALSTALVAIARGFA